MYLRPSVRYVGIPREKFDYIAALQKKSNWCWAACIQMVLNYHGINITQDQIVARTHQTFIFGQLPDWAANIQNITDNLNNWSIDNQKIPYIVQTSLVRGAPKPKFLLDELQNGYPIIAAHISGINMSHAVVIIGAEVQYDQGITKLIVSDPMSGQVEYPATILADTIEFHWCNIRVQIDKVAKYREYIQKLLTEYAKDDISTNEVDVQLIFDTERDHYQWMNVGWENLHRVYMTVMHFDIKNGKIWLQQNLTEENPAEELVKMGVPREDIVLGLHPPYKRPYTDYGVA